MSLFLKKSLSEEEFDDNFNSVEWGKKTLVCFGVEDQPPLWKLWGYAYNDPQVEHAELIILRELSKFVDSNHSKKDLQYKVTLYTNYSPCLPCSEKMIMFLNKFKGKMIMNLNISKLYKFHDYDNKRALQILKNSGVVIKIMDLEEYKECFYLFVNPAERFQPCEELDIQSQQNKLELEDLWSEEFDNYIFKTNENSTPFGSEEQFTGYSNKAFRRDIATPKRNEHGKETQTETPMKLQPIKDKEQQRGFKRKLLFD
ncbi:DNA dC-_dU-editing enzyme APOBEC-3G-like [Pseudophryne corroboree]|uniref:DNA dC->dU-editing enzyme APOBEC-3G-like n=1 Tax=Pseudophryne corroboree TaxID=495146 RepID=UPI00308174FB